MKSALLVGNGLNRCYENAIPWDKLLRNIANEYHASFNSNNPFPLEFEAIANQILARDSRKSKDVYSELKGKMAQMVCGQKPVAGSLHELFVKDIPLNCILTTNYDYMLERAFYGASQPELKAKDASETKYSIYRFAKYSEKSFYHIHGEANYKDSLCLGYEHYAAYLAKMREYLKAKPGVSQRIIGNELPEKSSWIDLFFTHDVYIVGLKLNTNEIDLWWLLTYRAYLYYSNDSGLKDIMKNRIKIFLTHDDQNQQELFNHLHVETEFIDPYGNYELAYREIAGCITREISERENEVE